MTTDVLQEIKLTPKEHAALSAQASNYRAILRYLVAGGFNEFLKDNNKAPIDLLQTPDDTTGGESAMFFLKSIADECNRMDQKIKDLSEALVNTSISLAREKRKKEQANKSLLQRIRDFMFVLED